MQKEKSLYEYINMSEGDFPIRCHENLFFQKGPTFGSHWHEHLEFHYYTNGKAKVYCNSSPIYVEAGDLIVINSNELHSGESLSEELGYLCIIVGVDHLHGSVFDPVEIKYITPIEKNLILFENRIKCQGQLEACIKNISYEYSSKHPGFELEIKSGIYHLLAILMRNHVKKLLNPQEYRLRSKILEKLKPVLDYIEESFNEEITIEKMSRIINISSFHFCRLFKKTTGMTLSEYVNRVRIGKAEMLLNGQNLPVSEIALKCGFNDINYFSRVFRNLMGNSPSNYKKAYSAKEPKKL